MSAETEKVRAIRAEFLDPGETIVCSARHSLWGQVEPAKYGVSDGWGLPLGKYVVRSVTPEHGEDQHPDAPPRRRRLALESVDGRSLSILVLRAEVAHVVIQRPAVPMALVPVNDEIVLASWANAGGPYVPLFEAARDAGVETLRKHLLLAGTGDYELHIGVTAGNHDLVIQLTGGPCIAAEATVRLDDRGVRPRWVFDLDETPPIDALASQALRAALLSLGFKES